jgi:DNA polymerase III alpha subunit
LFHIGEYFWLVDKLKPKSVEQLAMLLAVMRPSKKHLANKSWDKIEKEVWIAPTDGEYHFKKSHSISYSMAIVVQLNLLAEKAAHGTM